MYGGLATLMFRKRMTGIEFSKPVCRSIDATDPTTPGGFATIPAHPVRIRATCKAENNTRCINSHMGLRQSYLVDRANELFQVPVVCCEWLWDAYVAYLTSHTSHPTVVMRFEHSKTQISQPDPAKCGARIDRITLGESDS